MWVQVIGYLGSVLMFSTFYMKTMIPLRLVGIGANVCMIVFTAFTHTWPILILQSCLLPLNAFRLVQMRRLIARVKQASKGDFRVEALIPFMTPEHRTKGQIVFQAGDPSDRMYLVQSGALRLVELDRRVGKGDLVGEIGILSPTNVRTATAIADEDTQLLAITQDKVLQLYYQNPEFGFFLVRLVTQRLLRNLADAQFDAAQTLAPGD
jgi:CRP/FNR family cyclic AMP-dependent transcriptional regulator